MKWLRWSVLAFGPVYGLVLGYLGLAEAWASGSQQMVAVLFSGPMPVVIWILAFSLLYRVRETRGRRAFVVTMLVHYGFAALVLARNGLPRISHQTELVWQIAAGVYAGGQAFAWWAFVMLSAEPIRLSQKRNGTKPVVIS